MARSKPSDSAAPTGKAGRGPGAGRTRGATASGKGATAKGAAATGTGKAAKGEPKQGRIKKFGGQLKLIGQAYSLTAKNDPKLPWVLLAAFVVAAAVVEVIGVLLGSPFLFIPLAVVVGLLVALVLFTRRVQSSQYKQVEGQPGAAAWALETMRGDWRVSAGVAGTPQFDAVHRVLGRPGIVLVGEGQPQRVRPLIAQEKKKVARVVGDTPIYDILVGDGEGQVPLRKLSAHVMKLPRNLSAADVNSLGRRMSALGGARMPVPGGPLPGGKQLTVSQRQVRRRG
jgi:Domain of unknown function (DUF4191)